jgi:DNA primase
MGKKSLRSDIGKEALSYLKDKRGFSDESINKFNLGYMPIDVKNYDGKRHELAGRIILPIYCQYNNLIALSSRDWRKDAMVPFWHEEFTKSFYVYGLNISKESILKKNEAIVVEGEFDVIYLYGSMINNVVGILGSNFHFYQLILLSRYCNNIFIVTDGDKAGKIAIEKAVALSKENMLKKYDVNIIPVYLLDGFDPDDFVKKEGKEKFFELLNKSKEKL